MTSSPGRARDPNGNRLAGRAERGGARLRGVRAARHAALRQDAVDESRSEAGRPLAKDDHSDQLSR